MISRISDLNDNFEMDPVTHWVKAFRSDGDFYLIEPQAAMQLGVWSDQRKMDLMQAQAILEQAKATQANQTSNKQKKYRPTRPRTSRPKTISS